MTTVRPRTSGSTPSALVALRLLALLLGAFFVSRGVDKLAWFLDSSILSERLQGSMRNAPAPSVHWYIETIAMPGVPLFARLVPLAELATGVALILGFWPRLVAALALAIVANVHFALGSYFSREFLIDGTGLPVMGALLALAVGGARLPWSVRP
jgi:uncharacterized membrane protein YphA (DoxX/SURF4 family)